MSWKTNRNTGKKFQSSSKGIDVDAMNSMSQQDAARMFDYQITSRKPKGYGTLRQGYRSDRTGKYYSWVELGAPLKQKIGRWTLVRKDDPRVGFNFDKANSNETLTIRQGPDNNWIVFILGGNRYQPEYLTGGNSQYHNADAKTAFAKAYDYMMGYY